MIIRVFCLGFFVFGGFLCGCVFWFGYWIFFLCPLRMRGILTPVLFSVLKEEYQKVKKDSEKVLRKSGEQVCLT